MPTVARGGEIKLSALYRNGAGLPADATNVGMSLRNPDGDILYGPFTIPPIVDEPGVGNYSYLWQTLAGEELGTWSAEWSGLIAGGDVFGTEYIEVVLAGTVTGPPIVVGGRNPGYMTAKRFKKAGFGSSLTGVPDYELRANLIRASVAVDAYCNVPMVPQRYSFKGGLIVDEEHAFGRSNRALRIYPYHTPLREVTGLRILATENLYVGFDEPGDFFVQRFEGYVEIINFALTKIGIWGNAGIPSMGLIEPVARVSYSYGYQFPIVDEPLMPTDTLSGDVASEYIASVGWWDTDQAMTLKLDDVVLTGGYTIDPDSGIVTLDNPVSASSLLTASFVYKVPWEVQEATGMSTTSFLGERTLAGKGLTGLESIEVEEVRVRRVGSRSGAERGVTLPAAAQSLLDGLNFITLRGSG
jgi:hypothetical protein